MRYYHLIQNATEAWELNTGIAKQERDSETSVRANNTLKKIVVKIMVNMKFYKLKDPPIAEGNANDLLKDVFEETQFVHFKDEKVVLASTKVLYEKIMRTLDSKLISSIRARQDARDARKIKQTPKRKKKSKIKQTLKGKKERKGKNVIGPQRIRRG